jgi:hypothetical protein
MEVRMKCSETSLVASFLALSLSLGGAAYAQSSPSDDIRESNDPNRAAEVERKAEVISGQSIGGSGESEEEERGVGESGKHEEEHEKEGDRDEAEEQHGVGESGEREEAYESDRQEAPESSGGSEGEEYRRDRPSASEPYFY